MSATMGVIGMARLASMCGLSSCEKYDITVICQLSLRKVASPSNSALEL